LLALVPWPGIECPGTCALIFSQLGGGTTPALPLEPQWCHGSARNVAIVGLIDPDYE
jgi:hypothetical protein